MCHIEKQPTADSPPTHVAAEGTVSAMVLRGLATAVEAMGVSRSELLRTAEIDLALLDSPDARLPRARIEHAARAAMTLTHDPALGLHWAERLTHLTFGPISHLLGYVESLRQGFTMLHRFERLFHDEPAYALHERGDEATIRVLAPAGRPLDLQRFTAEIITAGLLRPIRLLCPALRILRASYAYEAPAHRAEYERIFGAVVQFEQDFTGIVFDRALLDVPSPHGDADLRSTFSALAEQRMLRAVGPPSYALRLRDMMVKRAPARLGMPCAAQALGLSERSLRRQLAVEDTSYQRVEHEALAHVARRLLRDDGRSIQETAFELGFSDATSFHRAFKQWTGETPSGFLARLREP
ncbi:MAG: AraC family transcriptional regulator [Polyangiales bacterium]